MSQPFTGAGRALRTDVYQDRYGQENQRTTRTSSTNYEEELSEPLEESFDYENESPQEDRDFSEQYRRMAEGENESRSRPRAGLEDLDDIDQEIRQADAEPNVEEVEHIDAASFRDMVDQLKSRIAGVLQEDQTLGEAGRQELLDRYNGQLDRLVRNLNRRPMTEDQVAEALNEVKSDFENELRETRQARSARNETDRTELKATLSAALDSLVNLPDDSRYLAFSGIGKNGHWEGLANLVFNPLGPIVNIVAEINKQDGKEWTTDSTRQLARAMKSALANDDWSAFNAQLSKLSDNGGSRVIKHFIDAFASAGDNTDELLNLIPPQTRREMLSISMNLHTDLNDTEIAGDSSDILSRSLSDENLATYRHLYENGHATSLDDLSISRASARTVAA